MARFGRETDRLKEQGPRERGHRRGRTRNVGGGEAPTGGRTDGRWGEGGTRRVRAHVLGPWLSHCGAAALFLSFTRSLARSPPPRAQHPQRKNRPTDRSSDAGPVTTTGASMHAANAHVASRSHLFYSSRFSSYRSRSPVGRSYLRASL